MINNISYFIQGDDELDSDKKDVNTEEVISKQCFKDDDSFKVEDCNPSEYRNLLQRAEDLSKHIKTLLAEAFIYENEIHLDDGSVYDLSSDDETDSKIENGLNTNGKFIQSYASMLRKKLPIRII